MKTAEIQTVKIKEAQNMKKAETHIAKKAEAQIVKKLTKRAFALLLCLAILAAVFPASSLPTAAEASGDYEYYITDETAKTCRIKEYKGAGGSVAIPSALDGYTVTEIGDYAFEDCTSLTSVTIPDSVTSIGWEAFYGCTSLTSVTIPDSVTYIGSEAFHFCRSLTSVTIGNSVTRIGGGAFENTAYYNNPANWSGDVLYLDKWLIEAKNTLSGAYEIKSGTVGIADGAFDDCTSLTSVTIPDSVTYIGTWAFCGCTSLTSVTIGDSVTKIGEYAFSNTAYYNDPANWTGDVLYIGKCLIKAKNTLSGAYEIKSGTVGIADSAFDVLFEDCTSLTSVTIPNSVTIIGDRAFRGCKSLASVTMSDSLTTIGNWAFSGCTSLTSVTIPDSVTSIGWGAFIGCTSLTSVTIPNSVTKIGGSAFRNCTSLTSVTIPDSVTEIGEDAFWGCASLPAINVDVANTVYTSRNGVLFTKNMKALHTYPAGKTGTSYVIPSSVTTIGNSAFSGSTSLTSITIPNGVTTIGEYAFRDCTSLTSVTIPDSVTSIGDDAFGDCTSLTAINVDTANTAYASHEGVLYNKEITAMVKCPEGKAGAYTVPEGVTSIDFGGCASLTSVTIPDSVTEIGYGAFGGCASLTSVTIPDSVTEIGYGAFDGCTSLTSVTIPNSVTAIDWYAFCDCTSLTSVTIPGSVTEIGNCAFLSCTSLTSVTIPDTVTTIGNSAFCRCTSLTSATIGSSVTSIGGDAFSGCTLLTDVYYAGTEARWKTIKIRSGNEPLLNATIHYKSFGPVNHMKIGRDNSTFANTYEPFFAAFSIKDYADAEKKSKKKKTANALNRYLSQFRYEISDEAFDKLLKIYYSAPVKGIIREGLGRFGKNELQRYRDTTWGGSCYGICASTALTFRNEINLKNFTGLDGSYYEVTEQVEPKDNAGLRDLINYYQLSCVVKSSSSKSLPEIISYAEKAEQTGEPFIIVFSYTQSGPSKGTADGCHAVLGVGSDGYDSSGTFRVRVIDPNHIDEYINMNISKDSESDNYSAEFSKYYNKADGNCQFSYFGVVTLSDLDFLDMDGPGNNEVAYNPNTTHISFGMNDEVTIVDLDTGKTLTYSGGEFSGNIGVVETRYCPGGDFSGEIAIDIEPGSRYKVELDGDTNLMIASDTEFYAFDTFGADSVEVDFDKGATLYGDDIQYNTYISYGENSDMTSVAGSCKDSIAFTKSDDGCIGMDASDNVVEGAKLFIDEKINEEIVVTESDKAYIEVEKGDVSGDKCVDNLDAALVLQYDAELVNKNILISKAGDVSTDGEVDNLDAAKILQYDAGLIDGF